MPSCARISLANLADATGIAPEALAAEVATLQRASRLVLLPRTVRRGERSVPPPPPTDGTTTPTPRGANDASTRRAAA